MIVDQALYVRGERRPCGDLSDELLALRTQSEGFLWIGLKDPTDDEFALVNHELGLHPLAVEDAVTGNQRAKIELYDQSLFVVLKTLRYLEATSDIETGEVMVFLGDRFVVTVRRGEGNPLAGVRQRLERNPQQLAIGPAAALHAVMDSVVDNYLRVDLELQKDLEAIEQAVFSKPEHVDANTIYRLKREVLEFRRGAAPLAESMRRLQDTAGRTVFPKAVRPFFRDVLDHLMRVIDHIESYDRLLTDILSAHLAAVSVQQNTDMRKISAWVGMAALPTMIAGIYGMNFEHMPELTASLNVDGFEIYYGYYVLLAVMALSTLLLYRNFKRHNWL